MTVSRIKVRLPTKFPSTVAVENPITLDRTGGGYTFGFDASPFMTQFMESDSAAEALAVLGYPGDNFGDPLVILCMGQSNFVQRPAYSWTPASNVVSWNYSGVDGNVGSAFVAVPSSTIHLPERIGSAIADEFPTRTVYVIWVAIGSQSISHWMVGTGAPDMYANTTANVVPALASIGRTKVDYVFWYQGESASTTPDTYVSDFNTVMTRFRAESWFPDNTPITIFSIAPTSISGNIYTDKQNAALQACVRAEPDLRRMIYTGQLPASVWDDTLHPSGSGTFEMGKLAADAALHGQTHQPLLNPLTGLQNNGSLGRPAFRNLIRNGDLTVNPWANGTSFVGAADATQFLTNVFWIQSGAGVVDITKTADAPTVAQAGIFTQHCIHVDTTTADASIGSTDYYGIRAHVSGADSSFLGFGQTGAKTVVVSFWVKATVTGNYFVAIENSALNRSFCTQYVVNASDTWEKKYVVIQGDTAGTWLYSGVAFRIFWTIASGDTYLFTPDVWNAADVRVGNATRANGMSSTSNNFKLALLQVEEGLYPSAFDRVPDPNGTYGTGIEAFLRTPSSANLATAVTNETGSGLLVFNNNPDLIGTATNDAAAVGSRGQEIVSSVAVGSAVSLTTATPANITSISLTAGDWDISGVAYLRTNAATTIGAVISSISTTSATQDTSAGRHAWQTFYNATAGATIDPTLVLPTSRISLSGTTTVYLVVTATFAVNTASGYGQIRARRIR